MLSLIEDFLPVAAVGAESAREKSLWRGHPSTLHLWWARRPLIACRAAVYGAMVPADRWVRELNLKSPPSDSEKAERVKNGKKLSLADLFNPKSNYLSVISSYCINDLKQQSKKNKDSMIDADMMRSGASARADNYKAWAITKKGLWITFDPYQVAPYAAGPQHVLVPYSALKDVIKPDGPVAALAK